MELKNDVLELKNDVLGDHHDHISLGDKFICNVYGPKELVLSWMLDCKRRADASKTYLNLYTDKVVGNVTYLPNKQWEVTKCHVYRHYSEFHFRPDEEVKSCYVTCVATIPGLVGGDNVRKQTLEIEGHGRPRYIGDIEKQKSLVYVEGMHYNLSCKLKPTNEHFNHSFDCSLIFWKAQYIRDLNHLNNEPLIKLTPNGTTISEQKGTCLDSGFYLCDTYHNRTIEHRTATELKIVVMPFNMSLWTETSKDGHLGIKDDIICTLNGPEELDISWQVECDQPGPEDFRDNFNDQGVKSGHGGKHLVNKTQKATKCVVYYHRSFLHLPQNLQGFACNITCVATIPWVVGGAVSKEKTFSILAQPDLPGGRDPYNPWPLALPIGVGLGIAVGLCFICSILVCYCCSSRAKENQRRRDLLEYQDHRHDRYRQYAEEVTKDLLEAHGRVLPSAGGSFMFSKHPSQQLRFSHKPSRGQLRRVSSDTTAALAENRVRKHAFKMSIEGSSMMSMDSIFGSDVDTRLW